MRRNARSYDNKSAGNSLLHSFQPSLVNGTENVFHLEMDRLNNTISATTSSPIIPRFDNVIEAKVEPDDTLQAIAVRFRCTVADIKRLNKIDKDNEIHARKVLKIPITVHNVLLDNLPTVHTSESNSPKFIKFSDHDNPPYDKEAINGLSTLMRNPLKDNEVVLSEKLIVASVNSSTLHNSKDNVKESKTEDTHFINSVILNSELKSADYIDEVLPSVSYDNDATVPLITAFLDNSTNASKMRRIRGPPLGTIDWSGSDCDMSWVCLFVIIIALCFVIPLVYVFYVTDHTHHSNNTTIGSTETHH